MDNLGITYQFLPPYSPDYNPIEMFFNLVKLNLKKFQFTQMNIIDSIYHSINIIEREVFIKAVNHCFTKYEN